MLEPVYNNSPITKLLRSCNDKALWSRLILIGRLPVINKMFIWLLIVPMSVLFLRKIPSSVKIEIYGQLMEIPLTLPFSWQAFYIAALCFSAGNLLLLIWCPRIVSENRNYADFQREGKTIEHVVWYQQEIENTPNPKFVQSVFVANGNDSDFTHTKGKFWNVYTTSNAIKPKWRLATALFFYLGFFAISIVAIQSFFSVALYLLPQWTSTVL